MSHTVSDAFEIDPDQLRHVIDRMATCGSRLRDSADQLQLRVDRLHLTWEGEAAEAHALAQHAWQVGFREMREALGRMRNAADLAHGNYTRAAAANLRLWRQVQ